MPRPLVRERPNRIAELRTARGLTQQKLSEAVGAHWTTISDLERGRQRLTEHWMRRIAGILEVSPGSLLETNLSAQVRVMGYVGAGAEIDPGYETVPDDGLFRVDVPFPLADDAIAFVIRGDTQWPRYDDGDLIISCKSSEDPALVLGSEAIVRTLDGRRFVKRVVPGSSRNLFDLESYNTQTIRNVRLSWIGQIDTVVRASQWRRTKSLSAKPSIANHGSAEIRKD